MFIAREGRITPEGICCMFVVYFFIAIYNLQDIRYYSNMAQLPSFKNPMPNTKKKSFLDSWICILI